MSQGRDKNRKHKFSESNFRELPEVVRGERRREWRLRGRRGGVAGPGLELGALQRRARRVEGSPGVTRSAGPGSHTPGQPAAENRRKLSPPPAESRLDGGPPSPGIGD